MTISQVITPLFSHRSSANAIVNIDNPVRIANKLAILGLKEGWGVDYVRLTYKRWFQEGKEPATEPNISEICNELKIDKEKVISSANSSDIENQYLKNTESARENKVFGSPTFIVNSEIFWGDDRMEDAITWSKKNG